MLRRYLADAIVDLAFGAPKMAFVSGPRQAGKTTLAKMLLEERATGRYANWDDIEVRRAWAKDPKLLVPLVGASRGLLVLDEIHKVKTWKRGLKGIWDVLGERTDVLVTGSARLNVYRKGGDSLLGRYYPFRLHPFSLREIGRVTPLPADEVRRGLEARSDEALAGQRKEFDALLRFGGFPEPLLAASERRARLWRRGRVEKVVREDLRDLTRIPDLARIEMLAALLPARVGSLSSVASLGRDLEAAHDTVTRWLSYLRELYYLFEVKPWQKDVRRSLRKEGKTYLWDWSEVSDPGARFENLVACHLLKAVDYWTDTGEGDFRLHYLRDKDKRELDFLVARDGEPMVAVEAKLSDVSLSPAWGVFLSQIGCPFGLQLVAAHGHWRWHEVGNARVLVASASEALGYFA